MPKLRKDEPIILDDNELYAVMRGLQRHIYGSKAHVPKPTGWELEQVKYALTQIEREFWARATEEQRIDEELLLINNEFEGRKKYERTNW